MTGIAEPSVKSLFLRMRCSGQPLATATGFVAESSKGPVLLTNRHNVTGRHQQTGEPLSPTGGIPDEIEILHNKANQLGHWVSRVEPLLDSGNPRWIEHPTLGKQADFVALPLMQLGDVQIYPYDPNDTGPKVSYGPADPVSVVGFPFGLQAGGSLAVWATGFMASEPDIDYDNAPVFLIDCRARPGQSGSAVIAYRSGGAVAMEGGSTSIFTGPVTRFLGIYSGRLNEQSDIGFVWKAKALQELLILI